MQNKKNSHFAKNASERVIQINFGNGPLSEQLTALSEATKEINPILDMIHSLAAQTDLSERIPSITYG
ncbi:hypothetical protein VR7878_03710 [Vibrio ruber DSM 16370]|uniref:Uncharacterized protein n=1 Tax=Vibrio ruber (strain DSM 16370 / JCM 11486 / BCRC 17186 / CECT 7878 / LMG 23124 / VR1) TaxID=1123498 RepID=A0A1R4LTM8_VIBR1|nr:hypothetical protein VR7878_03710 [Vibrio ruber DSM 16370]